LRSEPLNERKRDFATVINISNEVGVKSDSEVLFVDLYTPLQYPRCSVGRGLHQAADGIIANPKLYPAETGSEAPKTVSLSYWDYLCEARI
jgi:hypothetical protein